MELSRPFEPLTAATAVAGTARIRIALEHAQENEACKRGQAEHQGGLSAGEVGCGTHQFVDRLSAHVFGELLHPLRRAPHEIARVAARCGRGCRRPNGRSWRRDPPSPRRTPPAASRSPSPFHWRRTRATRRPPSPGCRPAARHRRASRQLRLPWRGRLAPIPAGWIALTEMRRCSYWKVVDYSLVASTGDQPPSQPNVPEAVVASADWDRGPLCRRMPASSFSGPLRLSYPYWDHATLHRRLAPWSPSVARFATRIAYGATQFRPRVAWYMGHGVVMRRLSAAVRERSGQSPRLSTGVRAARSYG